MAAVEVAPAELERVTVYAPSPAGRPAFNAFCRARRSDSESWGCEPSSMYRKKALSPTFSAR